MAEASLNRVTLIGRVGGNVEVRQAGQTQVANVSLATTKTIRSQDKDPREETEWHNLTFWGKKAEIAQKYVSKGTKLYVEGEIKHREKDGKKYDSITVQEFVIMSSPTAKPAAPPKPVPPPVADPFSSDDEYPF